MNHTKANLRALRETIGMSQQLLADMLKVDVRSVKRWEAPNNSWEPPEDAFRLLERYYQLQSDQLDDALDKADAVMDMADGKPQATALNYYTSQGEYEAVHPGEGAMWQMVNATTRLIGIHLDAMGWEVDYVYPSEI